MESLFRLGVVFRVIDRFTAPMKSFRGLVEGARQQLKELSRASLDWGKRALIAGAAGAAMFALPAHAFGQFEVELAAVRAMTGATDAEMQRLKDTAIQLGIETEHSPLAAIQAFRALLALGFRLEETYDAIRPTLALATAGQLELGQAAQTVGSAIKSFGLQAKDAGRVVDVLMKATTISSLKAHEYEMALGKMGAASVAANQEFEQMIALLGLMRSQGLTAESAAEKIKSALIALQSPTDEAQKLIGKLGIELRDSAGKMRPWPDLVDSIQAAIGHFDLALQDEILTTIFGREALDAYRMSAQGAFTDRSGNVTKGTDALRAMTTELQNSQGAAEAFQQAYLNTWPGKLKLLQGSWETLNIVMGEHVAAILKPFVIAATNALNQVIAWAQANPEAARAAVRLGLGVVALTLGFGVLALALWAGTAALGVLMGAFALLFSPVTVAIAIVAAFGAAIYLVTKNWEALGTFFSNLWGSIKATFANGVATVLETVLSAAEALPGWARKGLGIGEMRGLRGMISELRAAGAAPEWKPVDFRVPSFGELMKDLHIEAPSLPAGVTSLAGSFGRDVETLRKAPPVFHMENVNLHGVQNPEQFLERMEQIAGGMVAAEAP